jgi:transposase
MSVLDEAGEAEISEGRRCRRSWPVEEKRRIVAETYAAGWSVALVARRHDLNANMLFTWRREMRAAAPDDGENPVKFVPATITGGIPATALPTSLAAAGGMEIVLASGDRVIIGAGVDAAALTRVMKVLGRR